MELHEVKVLVPAERVSDFYRWFADWQGGSLPTGSSTTGSASSAAALAEEDARLTAASTWWRSLVPKERAVWGLWIDAAPKLLTADEIVSALGLNGHREIPGILSWSGRKGEKAGFQVEWAFERDAETGASRYGLRSVEDLSAVEYADLLRRAREAAEG